jgi:hypothetical protein
MTLWELNLFGDWLKDRTDQIQPKPWITPPCARAMLR